MNSYERVMTAFRHEEPDRVPMGELGIAANIYKAIMPEAGTVGEFQAKYLDIVNQADVYTKTPAGEKLVVDEWGVTYTVSGGDAYHPSKPAFSMEDDFTDYRFPDPYSEHRFGDLDRNAREYKKEKALAFTQRAFFLWAVALVGFEELLINMKLEQEKTHLLFDKILDYNIKLALRAVEKGADIIFETDDYAYNSGLLFGLDLFEEFVFPRMKRFVGAVHQAGAYVVKHTDGNAMKLLDGIVECGYDGLHSIDPLAGMDLGDVKNQYGDKLVLVGNIEPGNLLGQGSREDVVRAVQEAIDKARAGGGYIISASNVVMSTTNPENYVAMLETAQEYGRY